jgi:hypothetical protein
MSYISCEKVGALRAEKDYAAFCPLGQASFGEVSKLLRRAVLRCRKEKIKNLLIDSTGVSGFNKQSERCRISLLPTRIRVNNMPDEMKHG